MNDSNHACVVRIFVGPLYVRAALATNFEESDRAVAADGTTNALVSPPPRRVSPPKLYSEDSAR